MVTAASALSVHHQCVFMGDLIEAKDSFQGELAILIEAPRGTIRRPQTRWHAFGPGSRIHLPPRPDRVFERYVEDGQKEVQARMTSPVLTPQPPDEVVIILESAGMLDAGADVKEAMADLEVIAAPLRAVLWTTVGIHALAAGGRGFARLIAQSTAVWDRDNGQLHWRFHPPLSSPAQSGAFAPVELVAQAIEKMHTSGSNHLINAVLAYLSGCQATADPLAMMAFIQACEILAEELHSTADPSLPSEEHLKTVERLELLVKEGRLTKNEFGRLTHVGSGRKFRRLAEKQSPQSAAKDHKLFQKLYSLRSKTAHDGHLWVEAIQPGRALSARQEAEMLARKYVAMRLGLTPDGLPRVDSILFR